MNCPVCNRNLAPTLSICPSCGAMMNDSVREELKDKISVAPKPLVLEAKPNPPLEAKVNPPLLRQPSAPPVEKPKPALQPPPVMTTPSAPLPAPPVVSASQRPALPVSAPPAAVQSAPLPKAPLPPAEPVKTETSEIMAKPTSPTLVEFQNRNAALPDWRLQLQNAVRQRAEKASAPPETIEPVPAVQRVHLPTNGANALKAEVVEQTAPAAARHPKLENALRRIEQSRKQFLPESEADAHAPKASAAAPASNKNFPFYIASKNAEVQPKPAEMKTPAAGFAAVPKLEELPVIEKAEYDTNKLKPLPNANVIASSLDRLAAAEKTAPETLSDAPVIRIARVDAELESDEPDLVDATEAGAADEEIEDIAPFSMRFNAGLFDLIIGSFTAALLLSPLMLSGGNWFSFAGLLAFLVTAAIVMFIYMTTAIGFFGKTYGMKLFSLETIDIEENDYPTLHQAAVSSSVYLVSLFLGGIGFLPALFNSEKRAAHDLLSGTIIVKEY